MNSFGRIFRVSIFGESHGQFVGVIIDGCPPGIRISDESFEADLLRRKPGKRGTTTRIEEDIPIINSGIKNDFTTGAPILITFKNKDHRSHDYNNLADTPRPGHADFVAKKKYKNFSDLSGGGHFSGRLTLGLVAAGVIAKKILGNVKIAANIKKAGGSENIEKAIEDALQKNDSIGGLIECRVNGLTVGLGEPFFDSTESLISHIVFSIPAVKGIEFGSGFAAADMYGSDHNDRIIDSDGTTATNNAGGINGGITNGNELVFRVAIKPTSSIGKPQETINLVKNDLETLEVKGRHDACIALRMPVIVEAAAAIVLADLKLIER